MLNGAYTGVAGPGAPKKPRYIFAGPKQYLFLPGSAPNLPFFGSKSLFSIQWFAFSAPEIALQSSEKIDCVVLPAFALAADSQSASTTNWCLGDINTSIVCLKDD
jgi:hypothetical protein